MRSPNPLLKDADELAQAWRKDQDEYHPEYALLWAIGCFAFFAVIAVGTWLF